MLNIVPGTFPIVALNDIAQLDLANAATVATIAAFYVIAFAFVEVPLVTYCFAPERTKRLGVAALVAVGLYLMVHGIVQLVA